MDFKKSLVLNDPGDYPVFSTFEVVDIIGEFFGKNQVSRSGNLERRFNGYGDKMQTWVA